MLLLVLDINYLVVMVIPVLAYLVVWQVLSESSVCIAYMAMHNFHLEKQAKARKLPSFENSTKRLLRQIVQLFRMAAPKNEEMEQTLIEAREWLRQIDLYLVEHVYTWQRVFLLFEQLNTVDKLYQKRFNTIMEQICNDAQCLDEVLKSTHVSKIVEQELDSLYESMERWYSQLTTIQECKLIEGKLKLKPM